MIVQLSFKVDNLQGYRQGEDFAIALAEHVLDTFNDDGSIDSLVSFKLLSKKQAGKRTKKGN